MGYFSPKQLVMPTRIAIGVDDFLWHGVRHVVETGMARLRVPPHFRDMVLDHAPTRGSGQDYDHHDYPDEKLEALETWCGHVQRITRPAWQRGLEKRAARLGAERDQATTP